MHWLQLHPQDNVAVVITPSGLEAGSVIEIPGRCSVTATMTVARGHKVALFPLNIGDRIIKFGHEIGEAIKPIKPGDHVHTHNVKVLPSDWHAVDIQVGPTGTLPAALLERLPREFLGYPRSAGRAGVRNYIVVVASVNCSATVVKSIARRFEGQSTALAEREIHGVVPITHGAGCAMASDGLGAEVLNRSLAGWIYHPNVVGAVVVGLGCEKTTFTTISETRNRLGLVREIPLQQFSIQDVGGTVAAIEHGISVVQKLIESLPRFRRHPLPVSELALALNCGGSDAFSSLTANPLLGHCSDYLASLGATSVLAEIPECNGAEDLLYSRTVSAADRERLRVIFQWWQDYAQKHGVEINDNMSLGNVASGITTIIEKSLGAVSKGGSSPIRQVVDYAEPITKRGLVLMNTPGFDPVSITGLVAGGCNLVAFTTGRGSVYGCAIAPTLKLATTTELYRRMAGDMDFDAGRILTGVSMEEAAVEFFHLLVEVASGKQPCSEALRLGYEEFVPWAVGETL